MNGFEVYKKYKADYKTKDLYLILLRNSNKTVYDILFKKPTNKHNKEIYLQAKILFNLRENIFEKLFNKKITGSDSNQSDREYEESIAEN